MKVRFNSHQCVVFSFIVSIKCRFLQKDQLVLLSHCRRFRMFWSQMVLRHWCFALFLLCSPVPHHGRPIDDLTSRMWVPLFIQLFEPETVIEQFWSSSVSKELTSFYNDFCNVLNRKKPVKQEITRIKQNWKYLHVIIFVNLTVWTLKLLFES